MAARPMYPRLGPLKSPQNCCCLGIVVAPEISKVQPFPKPFYRLGMGLGDHLVTIRGLKHRGLKHPWVPMEWPIGQCATGHHPPPPPKALKPQPLPAPKDAAGQQLVVSLPPPQKGGVMPPFSFLCTIETPRRQGLCSHLDFSPLLANGRGYVAILPTDGPPRQ